MKISITGLKKVYTSGNVRCNIDISRKGLFFYDDSEIVSFDISLTKRITKSVKTGGYSATGYVMNGKPCTYWVDTYNTTVDDTVRCM